MMLVKNLHSGTLTPLGARSNARDSRILIHAREHERAVHDIMQSCMRSSTSPNIPYSSYLTTAHPTFSSNMSQAPTRSPNILTYREQPKPPPTSRASIVSPRLRKEFKHPQGV